MVGTSIQWTDATWNPVRGCSRVSAGCDNCYAMGQAHRFSGSGGPYEGLTTIRRGKVDWTGKARLVPEMLDQPLRWRKPRRIFVNSMSDLFHESLTDGEILAVFMAMAHAPQHRYQVLTKRPTRMLEWVRRWNDLSGEDFSEFKNARGPDATRKVHPSPRGQMWASYLETLGEPPPGAAYPTFDWMEGPIRWPAFDATWRHVWLGASVEEQKTADARIPELLRCPAAVRFVSYEPALTAVDLRPYLHRSKHRVCPRCLFATNRAESACPNDGTPLGPDIALDWVIVGGESGPSARPFNIKWARSVIEQCRAAGVACFVKQLGADPVKAGSFASDRYRLALRDRKGGNPDEWPADLRVREFPEARAS